MTTSDTPETDKATIASGGDWSPVLRETRQERDEARFLLKAAKFTLDAIHLEVGGWIKTMKENTIKMTIDYDRDQLSYALANALRERDEARELLASEKITRNHIIEKGGAIEKERDEARELLAKALVRGDLALEETKKAQDALHWSDIQDKRELLRERDEARDKITRQAERIRELEGATNHAGGLHK